MTAANFPDESKRPGDRFATTQWSLVLAASRTSEEASSAALEKLCRTYWKPLYAYVRRRTADVHEAHDLTQAFFAHVLEKGYLASADPNRGRFRAFLITAFQHFLSKEWEKARAQKRGGGQTVLSLDFADSDPLIEQAATSGLTAEQLYHRQWAVTLLELVMERLQREMEREGKGRHFQLLKDYLVGDTGRTYAFVAAELGLSESAARMAVSRLRRRYRDLLRDEIAQTVASPDDVEEELRHLRTAFD